MKRHEIRLLARMLSALILTLLMAIPLLADTYPSDTDYLNMVKRGQNYLFSKQTPALYAGGVYQSGGDWADSLYAYPVASTGMAVAALLDTGVPKTNQHVIDGINFLRQAAKSLSPTLDAADLGKGGIYSYDATYETGIALIAFSLYGDPADQTLVQNASDLLIARQGTVDNSGSSAGGWDYGMSGYGGDLSNTQFGVMGLYYASRYLNKPVTNTTWANLVFGYLQRDYSVGGGFSYYPGSDYPTFAMTGAGLWSVGMIGMSSDTLASPSGHTMSADAISWFNDRYTWYHDVGIYSVFAWAKALTIVLGADNKVGTHDWVNGIAGIGGETVNGLRYSMFLQRNASLEGTGDPTDPNNQTYWPDADGYWFGDILGTSSVLMSLGFADVNVPVPERILAMPVLDPLTPNIDIPVKGSVVIKTDNALIDTAKDSLGNALPFRFPIDSATKTATIVLPVGGFNFSLINVTPGGSVDLRIEVPASSMDPLDPAFNPKTAFVDNLGNVKPNIKWYKMIAGVWKPLTGVPVSIDKLAHVIIVTLTDGGAADQDGVVNGVIVDPGGVGLETLSASPPGGTYTGSQTVTLTADLPLTIYYTTNGLAPTTSSSQYSAPLTIANDTVLKFTTDGVVIKTETYTIISSSYTVTFAAGANGTLTGTTNQTINSGGSTSEVTAVPATGYHFVNWTGTGGFSTTTSNPLMLSNVTSSQTITANFAIDTFAINFASGGNGTLTGTASQTVNYNASATAVTAVPATGYHFVNWTGTGGFVTSASNPLTVSNVTSSMNITASFAVDVAITTKPATKSLSYKGARGLLRFTAPAAVSIDTIKALVSSSSWVTVDLESMKFVKGKGSVKYSVAANATIDERAGSITISNASHSLSQAGAPCKIISVTAVPAVVPAAGGTQTLTVDLEPNACSWQMVSIKVSPLSEWFSDQGNYPAAGTVLVGDQTFTGTVAPTTVARKLVVKLATNDNKSRKTVTLKQLKPVK